MKRIALVGAAVVVSATLVGPAAYGATGTTAGHVSVGSAVSGTSQGDDPNPSGIQGSGR